MFRAERSRVKYDACEQNQLLCGFVVSSQHLHDKALESSGKVRDTKKDPSHAHARDDTKHPRPGLLGEGGALLSEPLFEGHEEGRRHARVHVVLHPVRDVLRRK